MPIIIIVDWQVSIRYCEIKNFSKIFGYDINCQEIKEYVNLMNYLTVTRMNIVELLDLSDTYYEHFEGILQREARRFIIRKSKFPQNPKRSVRFSGKRTKRSVQKRKARNTQKAETKVL